MCLKHHECLHLLLRSLQNRLHLLLDLLASCLCLLEIFRPEGVILLEKFFKILMPYLQARQIVLHRASQETLYVPSILRIGTNLEPDSLYPLM